MKAKFDKQVGFRLPPEIWREIQRLSEKEMITPSIFIRRAVVRELERQTKQESEDENRN